MACRVDQNLINEYKGHVLEYLVGLEIAKKKGVLESFIATLPSTLIERLTHYQNQLYTLDAMLVKKLPSMAIQIMEKLIPIIDDRLLENIIGVEVVGKTKLYEKEYPEADIVVRSRSQILPIGLKFCKLHSYVNTKNAGIRSFLSKYFHHENAVMDQIAVSKEFDQYYQELGTQLYAMHDAHYLGEFDDRWIQWGHSHLPGENTKEIQQLIYNYYHKIIKSLYKCCFQYAQENPELFWSDIIALMGLGHKDIVQVFCFHDGVKNYSHIGVEILTVDHYSNLPFGTLQAPQDGLSFFEIHWSGCILQIRIKPMNTFTTPNVKINCSVKYTVLST